jgi:hypothetical protein
MGVFVPTILRHSPDIARIISSGIFMYIWCMAKLLLISLTVLIINIPFGYWRANVGRFSLQWFLAVHIPVIFIIALRLASHLGFAWYTYMALVAAFFLGQQFGSLVIRRLRRICENVTSCMVMDLWRCRLH